MISRLRDFDSPQRKLQPTPVPLGSPMSVRRTLGARSTIDMESGRRYRGFAHGETRTLVRQTGAGASPEGSYVTHLSFYTVGYG